MKIRTLPTDMASLGRTGRDPAKVLLPLIDKVAHDLHAPLRNIRQAMMWLEDDLTVAVDDAGRDHLRFVTDAADRLDQTLDGLVAYSRVCTASARPAPTDLEAVVDAAWSAVRARVPNAELVFVRDDLPTAIADPDLLLIALEALFENAVEYRSTERLAAVAVHVEMFPDSVALWVADTGIGIDREFHDRIFDPLHRLHTHDEHPGVGLGLPIARAVANAHQGSLSLTGSSTSGSLFLLEWPQPAWPGRTCSPPLPFRRRS